MKTGNRYEDLVNHFLTEFTSGGNFPNSKKECTLTCEFKEACKFDASSEASFSGTFGDPTSKIMIIAESPSTGWGIGAYLSGKTENLPDSNNDLYHLLSFVKDNYNEYPYFTDWIKCGVSDTRNKAKLTDRKKHCVSKHLMKEIELFEPSIIICAGTSSYNDVYKKLKVKYPNKELKGYLFKITHFSRRASLPLSVKDKKEIIWKLELGLFKDNIEKPTLHELEHFKKKLGLNFDPKT